MADFTGSGAPLTPEGFAAALAQLGAPAEALWSVLSVETSGCGYLTDRRPKILFERHHFHAFTGGRYDVSNPEVSNPAGGGYGAAGAHQYDRLAEAIQLDREAALKSTSWGLGQVMGSNSSLTPFGDVEAMVAAFVGSEDNQLAGMAGFVVGSGLAPAIGQQNWATFAKGYNGVNYAQNNYDGQLATFFAQFTANGCPNIDVRRAQVWLGYRGTRLHVDGVMGPNTAQALQAFQTEAGIIPADGTLSPETLAALAQT